MAFFRNIAHMPAQIRSFIHVSPFPLRSLLGQHLDLMLMVTVHKSGCPDVWTFRLSCVSLCKSMLSFHNIDINILASSSRVNIISEQASLFHAFCIVYRMFQGGFIEISSTHSRRNSGKARRISREFANVLQMMEGTRSLDGSCSRHIEITAFTCA